MLPAKYKNYVRKSDELARASRESLERQDWNATVSTAILSAISIADAICVCYLGERSADRDHKKSVDLLLTVDLDREELKKNTRHLAGLLRHKNEAEYEEKLFDEKEALAAFDQLDRFRTWAKSKLQMTRTRT